MMPTHRKQDVSEVGPSTDPVVVMRMLALRLVEQEVRELTTAREYLTRWESGTINARTARGSVKSARRDVNKRERRVEAARAIVRLIEQSARPLLLSCLTSPDASKSTLAGSGTTETPTAGQEASEGIRALLNA